jgi:hypothetical protein
MKSVFALVLAATTAFSAQADCTLYTQRQPEVSKLLRDAGGWSFKNYDEVCAKLERANATVVIHSEAVVLDNRSIGWATVMLKDRNNGVMTADYTSSSTKTNSFASQNKADALMLEAINDALNEWRVIDKAVAELNEARRATLGTRAR